MSTASLDHIPMCPRATVRVQRGFTLVELVVVLVLLGIVAATVGVRMSGSSSNLGAQADQLASDIRYVQSLSMTRGQRHCIAFTVASYQITNTNCAALVVLPTSVNPMPMGSGTTLAFTNALITFDTLGRPFTDAAATTALAAVSVITLRGGGQNATVRITPQTGLVTVP